MQEARAVLFDTRSIQQYIFTANKLKANIGASYIVSHVFDEVLLGDVLKPGSFGIRLVDSEGWKNGEPIPSELPEGNCYIAYMGGGNALILFSDKGTDYRKEIVGAFTEQLLIKYPGLKIGVALGMFPLGDNDTQEDITKLYSELKNNQFILYPQTNVSNTGLTLSCEVNGEAANAYVTAEPLVKKGEGRFFSQEVAAKVKVVDKANDALHGAFSNVLGDYVFPKELERLGQKETDNYIAVVHVDGNNMGTKFQDRKKLKERGQLSKKVTDHTKEAFQNLLKDIVCNYESYNAFLDLQTDDKGNKELPLRPLVLGGDDITFVCNGRLALVYTQKLMEYLATEKNDMKIDSCAGIAIVPTAYPFFRAYELAEQLCDVAKKKSRKEKDSSWLDFAILHGEQAPTIEQIRKQEYMGSRGDMHFGPYRVDGDGSYHYHVKKLLQAARGIEQLQREGKLPRNKWKELRNVLQHDEHDMKRFMEQLRHNGYSLPHVAGWEKYEEKLWDDNKVGNYKTPYIDAIEIIDFIPPKEAK